MMDKVLVRNRKTGKEKWVPPSTAEMMKNEAFLKEEWEVPKPGSPTPNTVVKFIERKENGEDPQPEVVEFTKNDDGDLDAKLKETEAILEDLLQKKAKAKEEAEAAKEDLSVLSVKKLADRIEYLPLDQLEGLKIDERVSIVRMVEKELKKRNDEKGNTGDK